MCNMTSSYAAVSGEKKPLTSFSYEDCGTIEAMPDLKNERRKAQRLIAMVLVPPVVTGVFDFTSNDSWVYVLYTLVSLGVAALIRMACRHRSLTRSLLSKVPSSDDFKTATSAKISSTIKRISSNQCWESLHGNHDDAKARHVATLSDSKLFVPLDIVSQLTLSEITRIFQYAKDKNSHGKESTSSALEQAFTALDASVSKSRGPDVIDRTFQSSSPFAGMEALRFCAAVRIFAEWSVVRQVPEGYTGYAVGMNLGKRDIVQNLAKMENAIHKWIDVHKTSGSVVKSPSLRELLEHEVNTNVHRRLPKLKEKTAAIGLVWIHRQLQYHTCVYSNITTGGYNKAALDAYKQVYDKYHGWAVQKMFNYSFKGAPPQQDIYRHMNPVLLQQVTEKWKTRSAEQCLLMHSETLSTSSSSSIDDDSLGLDQESDVDDWEVVPNVAESSFMFDDSDDEDEDAVAAEGSEEIERKKNPFEQAFSHIARETQKFEKNMERGWSEFVSSLVNVFDKNHQHKKNQAHTSSRSRRGGKNDRAVDQDRRECFRKKQSPPASLLSRDDDQDAISVDMTLDAHSQMKDFLQVAQPMMTDILSMVEELNMNDPTKV